MKKELVFSLEETDKEGMYTIGTMDQTEYTRMFIKAQETYLNNVLTVRGHVFLNEAFDALSIKRTNIGAVAGWLKTPGSFITIDMLRETKEGILLRFNVNDIIVGSI